jgi:oligopeptide/dipeptide ABC transporter ATP-binding protein
MVEMGTCDEVYTAPLPPYTQALLSAALPLRPTLKRQRIILSGEVPNPLTPLRGAASIHAAQAPCHTAKPKNQSGKRSGVVITPPATCTDRIQGSALVERYAIRGYGLS